jgi:hypothetical protein
MSPHFVGLANVDVLGDAYFYARARPAQQSHDHRGGGGMWSCCWGLGLASLCSPQWPAGQEAFKPRCNPGAVCGERGIGRRDLALLFDA